MLLFHCRGAVPCAQSVSEATRSMFGSSYKAVLSPCIGVCALSPEGFCEGCHRTAGEIARWPQMSDDERLRLMTLVLPEREAGLA